MNIALGCDHGAYDLKEQVKELLAELGHDVDDVGCHSLDSVNYPDYADAVCERVAGGKCERGILICGTGIGMSMAANRNSKIRAALCHELFTAEMCREHNDANVLCMGARVIGPGLALEMVKMFIDTEFGGGRHQTRIDMFS